MRSARAPRLLRELLVVSDELLIVELLPEVEGEALVLLSVLEVDEPEVEPEAPMPDELLLGVLVDEELVLGVVDEVEPELVPEAPMEPLDELLGVLDDEDDGVEVLEEEPAPMPEPALSPPVLGAVEVLLPVVPLALVLLLPAELPEPPVCAAA